MLASKGLVFAAATLIAGEIMSFTAFGIGQALLARAHASLAQPGVLRATIGGGLYLTAVGLLGFGIGALVRHTAGALSAFFGILFALTAVTDLLPTNWRNDVINYLPANAGSQVFTVIHPSRALPPWAGLGVLCLYALAALTEIVTGEMRFGCTDRMFWRRSGGGRTHSRSHLRVVRTSTQARLVTTNTGTSTTSTSSNSNKHRLDERGRQRVPERSTRRRQPTDRDRDR